MTIRVGDIVRADMLGTHLDTDEVVMSYQFSKTAGDDVSDGEAMLEIKEILRNLWDILEDLYNIYVAFQRLKGQNVLTLELLPEQSWAVPLAGVNPGDASPAQATWPLSFPTTTPRVMMRKMFGPTSEGALDADGLSTVAVDGALAAAAVFLLDAQVEGDSVWQYGYYSPKTLVFEVPTSATFTRVPGSLRRRRLGQGS